MPDNATTGPTPPPIDPSSPPLAKPSAPAPNADPAGIATTIIKQDGEGPWPPSDTAKRARIEEELDSLDELPAAAAIEKDPSGT
jgi:hypothetical protein